MAQSLDLAGIIDRAGAPFFAFVAKRESECWRRVGSITPQEKIKWRGQHRQDISVLDTAFALIEGHPPVSADLFIAGSGS